MMKTPFELSFKLHKFSSNPLANAMSEHRILSILGPAAYVGKTKKIKRLRFSFTLAFAILGCKPAKFYQPRFVLMELQAKLQKTFAKVGQESFSVLPELETNHEVVAKPDDDNIATGMLSPPLVSPQVQHVMQGDVCKQGTDTSSLRYALFTTRHCTILKHACVEPLLDVSQDALVRDTVLNELHQPLVVDGVK
jgi:hypothetical protein